MKRLSRLTALLLALMMLFTAAAYAEGGIPLESLTADQYAALLEAAQNANSTSEDDPWGIGGECGEDNPYCTVITNMLANMTAQEIYDLEIDL